MRKAGLAEYSMLTLGVAGGAGHVYDGDCSSSFLLLRDNEPICLVDLGLGVTCELGKYGYSIPDTVIITHNHSDHAGELPVVIRVEEAKGRRLKIVSATPVTERLKTHRMSEHNDLYPADSLAVWCSVSPGERFSLTNELDIVFVESKHAEICFGFMIYFYNEEKPILGYTADSGFSSSLYELISECDVSIFDARPNGNQWHAGIDELEEYQQQGAHIIGHGIIDKVHPDSRLLQPGQRIVLRRGSSE